MGPLILPIRIRCFHSKLVCQKNREAPSWRRPQPRAMRASTARSPACFAALILATSGRAETPYMPLTCCGFDTAMMLERLFKCKVGEEGKPWSKYCANGEAQHCAHYIKLQKDGAHFCCERCRLRSLGEWDNNPPPVSDEPVAHHAIRVDADGYSTGS